MNYPIRVLHIISTPNRGGAETMIMNIYNNIDRTKIQFDFTNHGVKDCDFREEINKLGGNIFQFSPIKEIGVLGYINQYYKFFKTNNYNIIHSHLGIYSVLPLIAAKLAKVKVRIVHSHSSINRSKYFKNNKLLLNCVKFSIDKTANVFLTCSKNASEYLFLQKRIDSGEIKIIKNGIDCVKFRFNFAKRETLRRQMDIDDSLVIGHVGRYNKEKNHKFLIELFYFFLKSHPNSVLLLVGRGELENEIETQINRLGISEHVVALGLREDVADILNAIDVLIMPSLTEGFPVSMVEAQANGLPCIVSDTITKETKLTDNVIYLDLKNSTESWANEISRVVLKGRDEEAFIKVEESGFDINKSSSYLESLYINLLNIR